MSLLSTFITPNVEAIVIAENSYIPKQDGNQIYKATFEVTGDETETNCDDDWDSILESLHITFMQQEALRFEKGTSRNSESFSEEQLNNFTQKRGLFEDRSDKKNNEESSYEGNDSDSHPGMELGDIRVLRSDDEESDDEDEESEDEDDSRSLVDIRVLRQSDEERDDQDDSRRSLGDIRVVKQSDDDEADSENENKVKRSLQWFDDDVGILTDDSDEWMEDACSTLTFTSGTGCEDCPTQMLDLPD